MIEELWKDSITGHFIKESLENLQMEIGTNEKIFSNNYEDFKDLFSKPPTSTTNDTAHPVNNVNVENDKTSGGTNSTSEEFDESNPFFDAEEEQTDENNPFKEEKYIVCSLESYLTFI